MSTQKKATKALHAGHDVRVNRSAKTVPVNQVTSYVFNDVNLAENPVENILAGLINCLNIVGRIVAKELGFTIKKLKIEVSGNINPGRLFGTSIKERTGFKEIKLDLIPETDADINTLVKWLKIVEDRCLVKDNLKNSTPLRIGVTKEFISK